MSDEPIKRPAGAVAATRSRIYEHWCEHAGCSKWGGWGFGRRKDEPVHWFCGDHRAEGERYL